MPQHAGHRASRAVCDFVCPGVSGFKAAKEGIAGLPEVVVAAWHRIGIFGDRFHL